MHENRIQNVPVRRRVTDPEIGGYECVGERKLLKAGSGHLQIKHVDVQTDNEVIYEGKTPPWSGI
jgi:hypothetical protein